MGLTYELEESDFAGYAPDGTEFTAKVVDIKLQEKPYTDDDGNKVKKLVFKFKVVDPDSDFDEAVFYGETSTRYNTHPKCKLYIWSCAILGRELPPGFKLDTDDLLDQFVTVVIKHETYKDKEGVEQERNSVRSLKPAGAYETLGSDEEPFMVEAGVWSPEMGIGSYPERMLP